MSFDTVYGILVWAECISAIGIFIILFFMSAPYGRHYRKGWGLALSERSAWIFMESPAMILMPVFLIASGSHTNIVAVILTLIWELHYLQRTIVYPLLFPRNRKIFPALIAVFAFIFNLMNGYIQGYGLFVAHDVYRIEWLLDPRFIAGMSVFIAGYGINLDSDKRLRELRRPGENDYKIPNGGMFRFVSSPNYLGEIVEWTGWAILTWSLPGLVFAVFTFANLFPRAIANHTWYKKNFPSYPRERKAILPFII